MMANYKASQLQEENKMLIHKIQKQKVEKLPNHNNICYLDYLRIFMNKIVDYPNSNLQELLDTYVQDKCQLH